MPCIVCGYRWGLLLPTTFVLATTLTNILFKDSVVLKGPCPSCGAENFTYFGEVLSVAGNRGQNTVRFQRGFAVIVWRQWRSCLIDCVAQLGPRTERWSVPCLPLKQHICLRLDR